MKFRFPFALSTLALAIPAGATSTTATIEEPSTAAVMRVSVEGEVKHPGLQTIAAGTRLAPILWRAMPLPVAYIPSAALLRESARTAQLRLKAGLEYDLRQWIEGDNVVLADAARSMLTQLQPLPITGRISGQSLETRWLEIRPQLNLPAADGDRIIYPPRTDSVHIVGAVQHSCTLAHVPLRDARLYLEQCPRLLAADKDLLYVIQPDGNVSMHGIALWNRGARQSLAPGAVLYVPLDAKATRALDPDFNGEYARFLATQIATGRQEATP